MPQMPMQIQNRIFVETDPRSAGMIGKILGEGYAYGERAVFYEVHNMMGQLIDPKHIATVDNFNRYFKARKLLWRG